jgi:hypothetical protein
MPSRRHNSAIEYLCFAAVETLVLAQTGHDRSWPSSAGRGQAAFGGTSAGVTFRSKIGGF